MAGRSGAATVVAAGAVDDVIGKVIAGAELGTYFLPDIEPLVARKRWLAGQLQVKGQLILDAGAVKVLQRDGKSLLAVGVKSVLGQFERGELVSCINEDGIEIARGLVNYGKPDAQLIAGKSSLEFEKILGYANDSEMIHRDNMVLI